MSNKTNHKPATPSVTAIMQRNEHIALVANSPLPNAWEAARNDQFAVFATLGAAGAKGSVSLTQLGQAFAACVAKGLLKPDNAADAYRAYCVAWNTAALAMPEHERADAKPTEKGTTFDQSVSQFATFGLPGAVAQGLDADGEWSPILYQRIAAIYATIKTEDGRIDSLYSAYVSVNRVAKALAKDGDKLFSYPTLTDEQIAAACVKQASDKTAWLRLKAQLLAATKAAKKISPDMQREIELVLDYCERINKALEGDHAKQSAMIERHMIGKQKQMIEAAAATEAAKVAAE